MRVRMISYFTVLFTPRFDTHARAGLRYLAGKGSTRGAKKAEKAANLTPSPNGSYLNLWAQDSNSSSHFSPLSAFTSYTAIQDLFKFN